MRRFNKDEAKCGVDGALYNRFAPLILAYLCQQVSNEQDAKDLLLEVFIAAFNSETFSGLASEQQLPWLRQVARNKVIDRYRHSALLTLLPLERAMEIVDDK